MKQTGRKRRWAAIIWTVIFISVAVLSGCGDSNNNSDIPVYINPSAASLGPGQTQQFNVTIPYGTLSNVQWSVTDANGKTGGAALGTITSGGLYTAPASVPSPNPVIVLASVSGTNSNGNQVNASISAKVTIVAPTANPAVTVTPSATTVAVNGEIQLSAVVTNDTSNKGVSWSSSAGAIPIATSPLTATYIASEVDPGTNVTITATSVEYPAVSGTTTILVTSDTSGGGGSGGGTGGSGGGGSGQCTSPPPSSNPPQATVLPALVTIAPGGTQTLTATLSGDNSTNQNFTWVITTAGNEADLGTIVSTGTNTALYTAANVSSLQVIEVEAISSAYTCVVNYATIQVQPQS